jgi:hypothetical protein
VRWPSGWPGSSAGVRGLAALTPAEGLRLAGRFALWALIALLLVRGLVGVLGTDGPAVAVAPKRVVARVWPDEQARAFAAGFARAYLSYSPRRPKRYVRGLGRFMPAELVGAALPQFAGGRDQLVAQAVAAGVARLDRDRALVTVLVGLAGEPGARYLVVPVGRDERGGLSVYDLPAFVAPPPAGTLAAPESEPLTGSDRAALDDVLAQFFRSYLAGDSAGLKYLVAAGERVRAVSPALDLAGVDSIAVLPGGGADRRVLLVGVRARDRWSGAIYPLRYRVALVRADRWYVASVNQSPKEG